MLLVSTEKSSQVLQELLQDYLYICMQTVKLIVIASVCVCVCALNMSYLLVLVRHCRFIEKPVRRSWYEE